MKIADKYKLFAGHVVEFSACAGERMPTGKKFFADFLPRPALRREVCRRKTLKV